LLINLIRIFSIDSFRLSVFSPSQASKPAIDMSIIIVYYLAMTLILNDRFDENRPIYLQIMEMIKKAIVRGDLNPGDKLPSVREMAIMLKVNPNTVQRAYQELEREGITFTRRGQGNFVSEDKVVIDRLKENIKKMLVDRLVEEADAINMSIDEIIKILEEKKNE